MASKNTNNNTANQQANINNNHNGLNPAAGNNIPSLQIHPLSQYIKNLSFETKKGHFELSLDKSKSNNDSTNNNAPNQQEHQTQFQLTTKQLEQDKNIHELSMLITITCKNTNDASELYKLHLEYCGLFGIKETNAATKQNIEEVLMTHCASLIFPFARREMAAILLASGFKPILLDPINFTGFYLEYKKQNKGNADELLSGNA